MPYAAPQDSRTHLQVATRPREDASTWDFSCPPTALPALDGSISSIARPPTWGPPVRSNLPHLPRRCDTPPSRECARRIYRQAVFETKVSPRLHTDKGRDTMTLRWYGITADGPPEEQAAQLSEELASDDNAQATIVAWASGHVPDRPGRSLPLFAPPPEPTGWRGANLWVTGALTDPKVGEHPRLKRVGRQHRRFILQALASFADRDSGCNVTAANATIGRKAASLCAEHIEEGGRWRGRRTDELSEVTLAGQVSAMVAVLVDTGWLRERARGRHLNLLERAVAWLRHQLCQTRAGSVRDLMVPPHVQRAITLKSSASSNTSNTLSAWVCPNNPHLIRLVADDLWTTLLRLVRIRVVHTHQCEALLVLLILLIRGLLKRKTVEEPSAKKVKRLKNSRRRFFARPSVAAQKLSAGLISRMPWLLRSPAPESSATSGKPRKRLHSHALARILDTEQATGLTVSEIIGHIDATLAANRWEIHPGSIRQPLGWFRKVLRGVRAASSTAATTRRGG